MHREKKERNLDAQAHYVLIAALMMSLTMAFGGAGAAFADPNCESQKHADYPNCVLVGPGNSENSSGKAQQNNPNIERDFQPPGQSK